MGKFVGFLFKLLLVVLVLGLLGLIGFAYLGELPADQTEVEAPVVLDID